MLTRVAVSSPGVIIPWQIDVLERTKLPKWPTKVFWSVEDEKSDYNLRQKELMPSDTKLNL